MNRRLLLVDDEANILSALKRELRRDCYEIRTAATPQKGMAWLKQEPFGVVVSDLCMPGMDGVAFLAMTREIQPEAIRIMLTGQGSLDATIQAVNRAGIFAYMAKPWNSLELSACISSAFALYGQQMENRRLSALTERQNIELKQLNGHLEGRVKRRTAQLQSAVREGVIMLATAAEAKDDTTGGHVQRIAALCRRICEHLGLSTDQAESIGFFSMMHDVGKIHVPDSILRKNGPLDPEEWRLMQGHTVWGEKILGTSDFYRTAREIARSHHERWDGTGYPDGLVGTASPFSARIVAVADVFDALTHARPYKDPWPEQAALDHIRRLSGCHFDPHVVEALLAARTKNPFQSNQGESDHETGYAARPFAG